MTLQEQIEQAAKDKLKCHCGNEDWKQFLFVSGGDDRLIAGCKKCAATYTYQDGEWQKSGGPASEQRR